MGVYLLIIVVGIKLLGRWFMTEDKVYANGVTICEITFQVIVRYTGTSFAHQEMCVGLHSSGKDETNLQIARFVIEEISVGMPLEKSL